MQSLEASIDNSTALKVVELRATRSKSTIGPIDFEIPKGEVVGLIGGNGAGKSMLVEIILGLFKADSGHVEIEGQRVDPRDHIWKKKIGFVQANQGFLPYSKVRTNLDFYASCYEDWDHEFSETLRKRLELDDKARVSALSSGGLSKLAFLTAVSHRPSLIIVDEPTVGMDPYIRSESVNILGEMLRSGDHSILISSHITSDIQALADRLVVLKNGKMMAKGTKDDFLDAWHALTFSFEGLETQLPRLNSLVKEGHFYRGITRDLPETLSKLKAVGIESPGVQRVGLDEVIRTILSQPSF